MMKIPKDLSQSDVELYNRSRNDVICLASREIAVFFIIGALFAIFSMIWDSLLTLGKVKKVQGNFCQLSLKYLLLWSLY